MTATELADLVHHLPPGCALWRSTGGPLAWTDETHTLVGALHRLEILAWQQTEDGHKGRKMPTPIEPPPLAHEREEAEEAARQADAKRERHIQRRAARAASDLDT